MGDGRVKEVEDYDVVMWEKEGVFGVGRDVMDGLEEIEVVRKGGEI